LRFWVNEKNNKLIRIRNTRLLFVMSVAFLSHPSLKWYVNREVLIEHLSRFVPEVGATGRLKAEVGAIRGDAW